MLFVSLVFLSNVGFIFWIFGDLVYIICIGMYIYCFKFMILFKIKVLVNDFLRDDMDWWLLWVVVFWNMFC